MDKFHKPRTHRDKTKYDRRSESEKLMDDLEPILKGPDPIDQWEDEGGMDYSGAFESDIEET